MPTALTLATIVALVINLAVRISPNGVHRIIGSWGRPGHIGAGLASWPTDFSGGILPVPCHSHNDYWRTVPLYSAIEAGCTGVEADIWLFAEHLFVGHSIASLTPNRTLNSLYIDPLLDILSKQNPKETLISDQDSTVHGVFDTDPEQSLVLLIDFKTAGDLLWPYVQSALEPLRVRNYLTRSNKTEVLFGPVTVVGTGNAPFDLVNSEASNPHHDIFFDAPLQDMLEEAIDNNSEALAKVGNRPSVVSSPEQTIDTNGGDLGEDRSIAKVQRKRSDQGGQGKSGTAGNNPDVFDQGNSFYASVAFGTAIGQLDDGQFSQHQMDLLRGQIRGAHRRGLKARYWDLPFWPIGLRNHVWDVLVKEGVDMLNVDDVKAATQRDWNAYRGWWHPSKSNSADV
ncbi:Altered inheritance of mitochondria protein 6 [Lecanora helva]